jgi:tRNA(Ile)-lysidine synthase
MFRPITTEIPSRCVVACSGGADSLAALIFAHNHGKRDVTALYINHGSDFGNDSKEFVKKVCRDLNVPLEITSVPSIPDSPGMSQEAFWSSGRAKIYASYDAPVIVAHTLDDAAEWWLMRCMRGKQPALIKPVNGNVIRPFLIWTKEDMKSYLSSRRSEWMEDPTNLDGISNMRSVIRKKLIPVVYEISDLRPILASMYLKMIINKNGG